MTSTDDNATFTTAATATSNFSSATETLTYYDSSAGLLEEYAINFSDVKEANAHNDSVASQEEYSARMISVVLGPFFLIFGSAGNILSLVILRSGDFKTLSTCFYMSVLAVMDTGKFYLFRCFYMSVLAVIYTGKF